MIRVLIISIAIMSTTCRVFSQDSVENGNSVFKIFKAQPEIDSVSAGPIYWKNIINAGKIDLQGCEGCIVTSFDLRITAYTIYKSDSCSVDPQLSGTFHSNSAQLSKKMIKAISKAKQGTFTFYNIMAITPSKQEMNLDKIILYAYPTKDYYKKRVVTYKD